MELTIEEMSALPAHEAITMPIRFLPAILIIIRLLPSQPDWTFWTTLQHVFALLITAYFAFNPIPIPNTNTYNPIPILSTDGHILPPDPTAPFRATILALESTIDDLKEDLRITHFRLKGEKTLTVRESKLHSRAVAERNELRRLAQDVIEEKDTLAAENARLNRRMSRVEARYDDVRIDLGAARQRYKAANSAETVAKMHAQEAALRESQRKIHDADMLVGSFRKRVKELQRESNFKWTARQEHYRSEIAAWKSAQKAQKDGDVESASKLWKLSKTNVELDASVTASVKKVKELTSLANSKELLIDNLQRKIIRMGKEVEKKNNAFL